MSSANKLSVFVIYVISMYTKNFEQKCASFIVFGFGGLFDIKVNCQ